MNTRFLRPALFLFFCFSVSAALAQPVEPKPETKFPAADAFAKSNITYKIINGADKTYGYDILADNRLLIHQPSVPGATGNKGFKNAASAEKVAQLVIGKIKKGEMPPTVTLEEMKKLKASY